MVAFVWDHFDVFICGTNRTNERTMGELVPGLDPFQIIHHFPRVQRSSSGITIILDVDVHTIKLMGGVCGGLNAVELRGRWEAGGWVLLQVSISFDYVQHIRSF